MKKIYRLLLLFVFILCISGMLSSCGAGEEIVTDTDIYDSFTKIDADLVESDITFIPSNDGKYSVSCREREELRHSVYVEDGTLIIERWGADDWSTQFSLGSYKMSVTVYIPKELEELSVETVSGNVKIRGGASIDGIEIDTTSGNVELYSDTEELFICEHFGGGTVLTGHKSKEVDVNTVSGNVSLFYVYAEDEIAVDTVSGRTELKFIDAREISLNSVSGRIEGTVATEKKFSYSTVSGKVSLPEARGEYPCRISTVSGNIDVIID